MDQIKKKKTANVSAGEDVQKLDDSCIAMRMLMQLLWKGLCRFLLKN